MSDHKITIINTDEIIAYENNSRVHSQDQISQIAESINTFGFVNPVIVDGRNEIIAGHGRLYAARKIGLKNIPCIIVDDLTEEQKKAYIIADNKIAQNSTWDCSILADEISSLMNSNFGIDVIGFSDDELNNILLDEEKLTEKKEIIKSITKTRILISLPTGTVIDGLDQIIDLIVKSGGEVDYGGN